MWITACSLRAVIFSECQHGTHVSFQLDVTDPWQDCSCGIKPTILCANIPCKNICALEVDCCSKLC